MEVHRSFEALSSIDTIYLMIVLVALLLLFLVSPWGPIQAYVALGPTYSKKRRVVAKLMRYSPVMALLIIVAAIALCISHASA
jgi:hypothetical protein